MDTPMIYNAISMADALNVQSKDATKKPLKHTANN